MTKTIILSFLLFTLIAPTFKNIQAGSLGGVTTYTGGSSGSGGDKDGSRSEQSENGFLNITLIQRCYSYICGITNFSIDLNDDGNDFKVTYNTPPEQKAVCGKLCHECALNNFSGNECTEEEIAENAIQRAPQYVDNCNDAAEEFVEDLEDEYEDFDEGEFVANFCEFEYPNNCIVNDNKEAYKKCFTYQLSNYYLENYEID
jgi:hypothetical protein